MIRIVQRPWASPLIRSSSRSFTTSKAMARSKLIDGTALAKYVLFTVAPNRAALTSHAISGKYALKSLSAFRI